MCCQQTEGRTKGLVQVFFQQCSQVRDEKCRALAASWPAAAYPALLAAAWQIFPFSIFIVLVVAADSCWQIIKAAWCNIVCKCLQKWSGRKGKFHLGRLEGRRPFMKTDEFKCKCVHRKLVKCHYQNAMIKISSLYFLEKEPSSVFHLQEGNFLCC